MVRVGIVGCGAIHATHAEAIGRTSNAQVSGFYDLIPERSAKASTEFGAPAYPDFESLCADSDAVSICVPSGLHGELGVRAAALGKHVLVEKPIEVTLGAARQLVEACRGAKVKLSVISQHRFAPDIRRLRELIERGDMGAPIEGDAYIKWYRTQAYYDSGDWRATWELDGGGCLMNQGVHYVDMIQWVMGGVKSVMAQVRTAAHRIAVEDVATALVEYKSGAIGVIQASTSFFPGFSERLEVHAHHGSVIIESDVSNVWEIDENFANDSSPYGRGVRMQPTPNVRLAGPSEPLSPEDQRERWIRQHWLQIQDFVDCVEQDREPFITGEMALEPLKVILAVYESAKTGQRVLIS